MSVILKRCLSVLFIGAAVCYGAVPFTSFSELIPYTALLTVGVLFFFSAIKDGLPKRALDRRPAAASDGLPDRVIQAKKWLIHVLHAPDYAALSASSQPCPLCHETKILTGSAGYCTCSRCGCRALRSAWQAERTAL